MRVIVLLMAACRPGEGLLGPIPAPPTTEAPAPAEIPDPDPSCDVDVIDAVAVRGGTPLEIRIDATLAAPDVAWTSCGSTDVADDLLLVESSTVASDQVFRVRGLLPGTTYDCTVRTGCGGAAKVVRIGTPTLEGLPTFAAVSSGVGPSAPYTLFNTQQGAFSWRMAWVLVTDRDGGVRWAYPVGDQLIADIDATLFDVDAVHVGGGWGTLDAQQPNRGVFRTLNLSGEVLLERSAPDFGLGFNHHSQPLADGSYLSLTGDRNTSGNRSFDGVGIELWHPTAGLRWAWSSQQLFDDGVEPPPDPGDPTPFHANSVRLVTDALGDAAWVSLYGARAIWRVDRATGARTHVFGPDGDFTLVDDTGARLDDAEWPFVQHDPDYADDGRVLLYDNGQGRPGGSYSRVAEYHLDLVNREATLLWAWTEPGWYDPIVGDADYLDNGHVLITKGHSIEWSGAGDVSELVELAPPDEVVWRLTWSSPAFITFRAQRIDGCESFPNARYCDAVARRYAALTGQAP